MSRGEASTVKYQSNSSLVVYQRQASETDFLLTERRSASGAPWSLSWIAFLVILFLAPTTVMHFVSCPLDPSVRDSIRLGWKEEEANHELMRRQWKIEELQWKTDRQRWKHEAEERDRLEEEARQRWKREVEERDQREEEERQKLNMFWGNVQTHGCTTYATREYTATLMNLPVDWKHRVEACKATPLEVHGISYLPKTCEDHGPGVVIGHWQIDQREPYCTTFWDAYTDKGCTSKGSGKKRIEHHLMDIPSEGNWQEFCATTPIRFDGMQFSGAHQCFKTITGAVFGQWEIYDSNC